MQHEFARASLRGIARNASVAYAGVLGFARNGLAVVGLVSIGFVFAVLVRTEAGSSYARFSPRSLAVAADSTLRVPLNMLVGVLSAPAEKVTDLLGLNQPDALLDPQSIDVARNLNGPRPRDGAPVLSERKVQDNMGRYLMRKYRISADAVSLLVEAAYETGKQVALDPALLLAVMAVESGFNPFAESVMGAQGLMQVMSRVHGDKLEDFGGMRAALNPVANMRVGAMILKDCIRRGGSIADGLRLYSGAGMGGDGGYGAKVLQEQERIQAAAGLPVRSASAATTPPRAAPPTAVSVAARLEDAT